MSLLLAVAYNQFQNRTASKLTMQMKKRTSGLKCAFDLLAVRATAGSTVLKSKSFTSLAAAAVDAGIMPDSAHARGTSGGGSEGSQHFDDRGRGECMFIKYRYITFCANPAHH